MESQSTKASSNKEHTAPESLTYRVLNGLFWMLSGAGVRAFLRITILVILARLLTPEAFGLIGAAAIILNLAGFFFEFGMSSAIEQRPELQEKHLSTAFTIFTGLGFIMGGVVIIAAPLVALFFKMSELVPILRVIAIIFPIMGLTVLPTALIKRKLRFRRLAEVNIVSYALGNGLVGISLALMGFGVWALVWSAVAQAVISALLLLYLQPYPKRLHLDISAARELLYFGGGFTLGRFLTYLAEQGDNAVVGRWLGADALGFYGRAYQLLVFPVTLFGSTLKIVLLPSMAKVQHDQQRLSLAYRRATSLIALIFLPLSGVAMIVAPELIQVLLGPQWAAVVPPFQILAAGIFLRASYKMSDSVTQAMGAVYRRAWRFGLYAFLTIGGAIIGQNWGVTGVAVAVLIALAVNLILVTNLSLALVSMPWRRFLLAHVPALLLAVVIWAIIWAVTASLRSVTAPAILILLVTSVVTGVTQLLLPYLLPQFLLGEDGQKMVETLKSYVAIKVSSLGWLKRAKSMKQA